MDGASEVVDETFLVIVFVAVWLIGGNFPSGGIKVDIKFSEFVGDGDALEFRLRRDFVAESYSVIVDAKAERENATSVFGLGEV